MIWDDEEARKRQEHASIRLGRVGARHGRSVAYQELLALLVAERCDERPQAAALEPLHHRFGASGQRVIVRGAPDVDPATRLAQYFVIAVRRGHGRPRGGSPSELRRPGSVGWDLA